MAFSYSEINTKEGVERMKGVFVEVWGDYALFGRPEMKVERVSYDIITPSAARGILDAIYWHPGMKWMIDKIYVMNPIEFSNIRRNEVSSKISHSKVRTAMNGGKDRIYISTSADIQQRASTLLKNVRYLIKAHFEMTDQAAESDNENKFYAIAMRRLKGGQCYHQPCMGCREFPAHFRLFEENEEEIRTAYQGKELDLGYMLYDLDFTDTSDIQPMYFRAKLSDGILDLGKCEVVR